MQNFSSIGLHLKYQHEGKTGKGESPLHIGNRLYLARLLPPTKWLSVALKTRGKVQYVLFFHILSNGMKA